MFCFVCLPHPKSLTLLGTCEKKHIEKYIFTSFQSDQDLSAVCSGATLDILMSTEQHGLKKKTRS